MQFMEQVLYWEKKNKDIWRKDIHIMKKKTNYKKKINKVKTNIKRGHIW